MTNKIEHINNCIHLATNHKSKLNTKALQIRGMSSPKNRHLLNNILELPDARYLEIGTWLGSTLYSALFNNNPIHATAIDNFSQFNGTLEAFKTNMSDVNTSYDFINSDCFALKNPLNKKYNIYIYDGDHRAIDQEKALTYYYDYLDEEFIYICDDWNFLPCKQGTDMAIEKTQLKIIKDWTLPARYNGDLDNWWNGLWIAILQK